MFKINLFNLYYFILIVFTSFILKVYGFKFIVISPYIFMLLISLIILLTNNSFILSLFNIYNNFNLIINELSLENFIYKKESVRNIKNIYRKSGKEFKFNLSRQFSTVNNKDNYQETIDDFDMEYIANEPSLAKEQAMKEFKKKLMVEVI